MTIAPVKYADPPAPSGKPMQRLDVLVATRGHQRADPTQVPSGRPGALGVDEQAPLDLRAHQWAQTPQVDLPGPPRCRRGGAPPAKRRLVGVFDRDRPAELFIAVPPRRRQPRAAGPFVTVVAAGMPRAQAKRRVGQVGADRHPTAIRSREGAAARPATRPGPRFRRWSSRGAAIGSDAAGTTAARYAQPAAADTPGRPVSSARTWRFKPVAAVRNAALPTPRSRSRAHCCRCSEHRSVPPERDRSQPPTTHSQR